MCMPVGSNASAGFGVRKTDFLEAYRVNGTAVTPKDYLHCLVPAQVYHDLGLVEVALDKVLEMASAFRVVRPSKSSNGGVIRDQYADNQERSPHISTNGSIVFGCLTRSSMIVTWGSETGKRVG